MIGILILRKVCGIVDSGRTDAQHPRILHTLCTPVCYKDKSDICSCIKVNQDTLQMREETDRMWYHM